MLKNNYILTLDIGSSKVSGVLAQVRNKRLVRLFFDTVNSKAVTRGAISDTFNLISSLETLLGRLKSSAGVKNIKTTYVNLSGEDIVARHSKAIVPLAERGNKVITRMDLYRVNEQARILGSRLEEEILHELPFSYAIDSKENILNPIGLYSHRLEVDAYLICAKTATTQSLGDVLSKVGCQLKGLSFSGLATVSAAFGDKIYGGINILCDIGSDITEILFFKDGVLQDIEILKAGGQDLTNQLAFELKISFDLAEDLKRSHGIAGEASLIEEDKEVLIKKDSGYKAIKQRLVCQIISNKVAALSGQIKERVEKRYPLSQIDNFFVCGRTILLEGFLEMLENVLGCPVRLAQVNSDQLAPFIKEETGLSGQKYLIYLTALGLLNNALKKKEPAYLSSLKEKRSSPVSRVFDKVREVYQEYF